MHCDAIVVKLKPEIMMQMAHLGVLINNSHANMLFGLECNAKTVKILIILLLRMIRYLINTFSCLKPVKCKQQLFGMLLGEFRMHQANKYECYTIHVQYVKQVLPNLLNSLCYSLGTIPSKKLEII